MQCSHGVTVIVFARRPRPGQVKRRLAHALGASYACALYARLLARTLAVVAASGVRRRVLMPATAADCRYFRRRLSVSGWQVRAQIRGDLGQRMAAALASALAAGGPAVLIGSDLLDIRATDLTTACAGLCGGTEVVLGPAADGGYWLIGLRRARADLFAGMRWSVPDVFAQTLARCAGAGLRPLVLPCRRDLDHARDLLRGRARLPARSGQT